MAFPAAIRHYLTKNKNPRKHGHLNLILKDTPVITIRHTRTLGNSQIASIQETNLQNTRNILHTQGNLYRLHIYKYLTCRDMHFKVTFARGKSRCLQSFSSKAQTVTGIICDMSRNVTHRYHTYWPVNKYHAKSTSRKLRV